MNINVRMALTGEADKKKSIIYRKFLKNNSKISSSWFDLHWQRKLKKKLVVIKLHCIHKVFFAFIETLYFQVACSICMTCLIIQMNIHVKRDIWIVILFTVFYAWDGNSSLKIYLLRNLCTLFITVWSN